jgi:hypothetical protein
MFRHSSSKVPPTDCEIGLSGLGAPVAINEATTVVLHVAVAPGVDEGVVEAEYVFAERLPKRLRRVG